MVMAKAVDELERKTPGKKTHAIDAFSHALLAIPSTIADNAGLDSVELIARLRAKHHKEESNAGIDVIIGSHCAEIKSYLGFTVYAGQLNDHLMESKAGKKSSSKSLLYEAPLGYKIEDVRPHEGSKVQICCLL
ncbi:hypothetical protein OSB04_031121 [Centaurea solstitialis]|uniref:Uncharacterized protein n=1 Tax=Centaurea solstitialis TaxID=347529 RepID=A0AA38SU37_9ASTR|nr:hypothetical protein OSB04_031121 [Centaurea solstitialis]